MSRTTHRPVTSTIPRWPLTQLGHIARVSTGSADVQDADAGIYPFFIRSNEVRTLGYFTHDTEAVLTAGDGNVGEIFHHYEGKFVAHQRVYVIEPGRNLFGRYLYYSMRSLFKESLQGNTAKSTVESLRRPMLTSFRLPLPPMSEQSAIADYLDHETAEIDAFIADQRAFSVLISERQRALKYSLATGEISGRTTTPSSGASIWDSIPEHWSVQKLGWHFDVGNGSTPKSDNPRFWSEDGIPWVNSSVVNEDLVVRPSRRVTMDALRESHLPLVPRGSLVIGLTGQGKTRGSVTTLGIDTTINQHLAYLKPRQTSSVTAQFLRLTLEAAYSELRNLSDGSGGTKGALTCETVQSFRVPVPPMQEQRDLVAHDREDQTKVREMLGDARLAIRLAEERRTALISAAVTGQIDVTQRHRPVAEQLEEEVLNKA